MTAAPCFGQSRSEKVDQLASMLSGAMNQKSANAQEVYTDAKTGEIIRATPLQLMRETMTSVDFDAIPGRLALEIWASQTNVPLVINWKALEAQGIDPQTPISLQLYRVPGEVVLNLIIQQLHPDPIGNDELLLDVQQWYVRVMTREDALRRSTTRMYFIGDLLMEIPSFDGAPGFDLNQALSNTSTGGSTEGSRGGGNAGGGQGIFTRDDEPRETRLTKREKAERIVDMIRDTIEPDIWRENGGEFGSIRYYRGMLVVKAPAFVHEQIGGGSNSAAATRSSTKRSSPRADLGVQDRLRGKRSTAGNVAGVADTKPDLVR